MKDEIEKLTSSGRTDQDELGSLSGGTDNSLLCRVDGIFGRTLELLNLALQLVGSAFSILCEVCDSPERRAT